MKNNKNKELRQVVFKARLRLLIDISGKTRKEIAKISGMHEGVVSRALSGKSHHRLSLDVASLMLEAIGCSKLAIIAPETPELFEEAATDMLVNRFELVPLFKKTLD